MVERATVTAGRDDERQAIELGDCRKQHRGLWSADKAACRRSFAPAPHLEHDRPLILHLLVETDVRDEQRAPAGEVDDDPGWSMHADPVLVGDGSEDNRAPVVGSALPIAPIDFGWTPRVPLL